MADTLEQQVLKVVARESTPIWGFLCHEKKTFTLCSRGFIELFVEEPRQRATPDHDVFDTSQANHLIADGATLPNLTELEANLLAQKYQVLSKQCSPDYHLRFYSLVEESGDSRGTLLFVESRLQVKLTPSQALRTHQASQQIETLSPRESEVLWKVVSGMTNQAIAIDLGLSPKTIEKHRKKMMTKLRVQSVAEAARIAFDAELFELLLKAQHDIPSGVEN